MKTVGVTGGSGFIGGYVREELLRQGYEVVIFDRAPHGELAEGESFFLGDIRDEVAVSEFVAHVDGVIHLAAVLGTQETIENPKPAVETNVFGGLHVLEATTQYKVPLVYAGVGNHWMRTEGGGTYTITKTFIEDLCKMYIKNRGSRINVVRPVNAYGPRQSVAHPYGSSKVRKIMPSFVMRALHDDDIQVYGGGTQVSDCVHVRDVAKVFVAALKYTEDHGSLWRPERMTPDSFEVGPKHDTATVRDIAQMVVDNAESNSKIVDLPMRPGEVEGATVRANLQSLKLLKEYGVEPDDFIPLEDGIRETVQWYREWDRLQ